MTRHEFKTALRRWGERLKIANLDKFECEAFDAVQEVADGFGTIAHAAEERLAVKKAKNPMWETAAQELRAAGCTNVFKTGVYLKFEWPWGDEVKRGLLRITNGRVSRRNLTLGVDNVRGTICIPPA